jgi:uncharacterized protein
MEKVINITHNDLDGIGCPIVIKFFYNSESVEPIYCGYHNVESAVAEVLDRIEAGENITKVYITDISFRKESGLDKRIEQLNNSVGYCLVQLFDHHATSGYLNKYDWAWSHETDEDSGKKKCGTQWTYEFLLNEAMLNSRHIKMEVQQSLKDFVTLVNLWDTWRWVEDFPENPCTPAQDLNMICSLEGKKIFMERYIEKIFNGEKMISDEEQLLLQCKHQEIEKDIATKDDEMIITSLRYETKQNQIDFIKNYLESNHMTDKNYLLNDYIKVFDIGVVYLDRNISDVGNALAAKHPELDFILIVSLPKTVSFRAVKDLDVPLGIIANYLTGKGGGHPKSAGGVLPHRLKFSVLNKIIE